MMQTGTNRYLYNGNELQQMASLDFLDYGARMYDGYSGRWFNVDPLAEKYFHISPYVFCNNNSIKNYDADGKDWDSTIDHYNKTITISLNFTVIGDNTRVRGSRRAAAKWNAQGGKFNYIVGSGKSAIKYSIDFNVSVNEPGNGAENLIHTLPDNHLQQRTETIDGNEMTITPQGGSDGKTIGIPESNVNHDGIIAHEQGHNMGMGHSSGLMRPTVGGTKLSKRSVKETFSRSGIGKAINNQDGGQNATHKKQIEIGTRSADFQHGKIKRNKKWRDEGF